MSAFPAIKPSSSLLTGDEFFLMRDTGPCELIAGRIIPMSPTGGEHGNVESNVSFCLRDFVKPRYLGWVMTGEVGIYTKRDPDSVRAADVVFISREKLPDGPPKGFLTVAPELVVEVVSPSDSQHELETKVAEYLDAGTLWVWLVDPGTKSCGIYKSKDDYVELGKDDVISGEGILSGLEIQIASLFQA
jgi:Uma2 family endonuclease